MDSEESQYGKVHSAMDSSPTDVVGLVEAGTLGDMDRHHVVQ